MNVEQELAAVEARVAERARLAERRALAKIDAPTPSELRDGTRKSDLDVLVDTARRIMRGWRR